MNAIPARVSVQERNERRLPTRREQRAVIQGTRRHALSLHARADACPFSGRSGTSTDCPGARRRELQSVRAITVAWRAGTPIAPLPGAYEGDGIFPAEVMTCPVGAVATTPFMDEAMYDAAAASVVAVYDSLPAG